MIFLAKAFPSEPVYFMYDVWLGDLHFVRMHLLTSSQGFRKPLPSHCW